jgi:hypothetical protein
LTWRLVLGGVVVAAPPPHTGSTHPEHEESTMIATRHTEYLVEAMEDEIRDMAATVASQVATRRSHPTYGYTKTGIREMALRLEGAIGLYMVLTGQSSTTAISNLAKFQSEETDLRVNTARDLVKGL